MDCYSAESEFIESLDFLSPPVKRVHSREAFGSTYHNEANDVHLLRGLRNRFAGRAPSTTKNTRTVKTNAESSTSLILKKTSERQILGHYSVVSYTSLQRLERDSCSQRKSDRNPNTVKPLIKVTVIPKSDQIQTAKILRKRRYIPRKTVQSTSSNHENSVQTKNVYLIVAGRRKDKIYEIKTTGSATFSTDHEYSNSKHDEIPVKEISNFKHLIQSLNMDKKKRKDKKASMMNSKVPQNSVIKEQIFPTCDKCFLDDMKDENDNSHKKSRVRIFGQFGISEEDKYVLRYGATINDKQVLSDVAQLTRDFSPILVPSAAHDSTSDENSERQKDSTIYGHNANKLKNEVDQLPVADTIPSKESHGTQVNFNVQIDAAQTGCLNFADKKIQCCCSSVPNRLDHKALKDCQSPLVIISVYPKPSPENSTKSESNSGNNMRSSSPPAIHTYRSNQGLKLDKDTRRSNTDTKRNNKTTLVSRSSSPVKTRYPSRNKRQENKSIKPQVNESKSPDRHKALTAIKDKIQEKDKLNQERTGTRKLPKFTSCNATQVCNRKQQFHTNSNGTQVSTRDHKDNVVSNATQYFTPVLTASNGTQWVDSPQIVKHSKIVATIKNPRSTMGSTIRPQTAYVSNATQVSKCPQVFASNATQVSNNTKVSNMTQVSTNEPKFIASRLSKNQETVTSFRAAPIIKREQRLKPLPKLKTEKGTNTDHARAKRALIESYTKKLTEQMSHEDYIPTKFDSSRITINIDGDKEYYDVLFNQNKISTDMTIRKTLKDRGSQKFYEENSSASLENYLFLEDDDTEKDPGTLFPGSKSPTKPTSIALYNQSGDESPLTKRVSRLTIRDSIEISHRREDKSVHDNIKNTQTCFTAQLADSIPDETEFLAPIKHYTGDDCSLCNPIERDKQIRELLGVDNNRFAGTKTKQARNCERDDRFPYKYIYRHECKKSQVTEINFQFQKLCPGFKPMHRNKIKSSGHTSVSVQCQNPDRCLSQYNSYAYNVKEESKTDDDTDIISMKSGKCLVNPITFTNNANYNDEKSQNNYSKCNENDSKHYLSEEKPALYQQLILNRNIQVFVQVEKFSKQKPIILSRKQYNKVKKTIQKTICNKKSSHDKQKKYVTNKSQRSEVFVGEVRTKRAKDFKSFKEREAQTDLLIYSKQSCKRDKKRYIFNPLSYKDKIIVKKGSTDNSSPEHNDESDLEKLRKTEYFSKSHSEKKENPEICLEIKHKGKTGQNVKVCTVDCGKTTPWNSDQSELNREARHVELKVGKVIEQIVPYAKIYNTEINTKQEVGCGSDQLSTKKAERHRVKRKSPSPERYSEVKEYYWPRHYSGQDVKQNFQQYDDENEDLKYDQALERQEGDIKTLVLFNAENTKGNSKDPTEIDNDANRKTMSSVEIRYTSAAFMKQVAYSSTDVGALSDSSLAHGNSFHTIFRGHRKSPTPNLGTSIYSLYSEELNADHKSSKYIMEPRDSKPKKPFLRRLMSCLVMRSTRDSDLKLPSVPLPDVPSVNSSIDSYHISTSLGAMEVSSSIYDTSASFYSNHTILPINSKIKRGFFSSVRGFLTNRKS